jgi:hypothetical protein
MREVHWLVQESVSVSFVQKGTLWTFSNNFLRYQDQRTVHVFLWGLKTHVQACLPDTEQYCTCLLLSP